MAPIIKPNAARRNELIQAFNASVSDPRSYVYLDYKTKHIGITEASFDVKIIHENVGHGAVALATFETGCCEALPFTLGSNQMGRFINDDDPYIYGFHKYVAHDIYSEFLEAEPPDVAFLDIWQTAEGVLARVRELDNEQIEVIRTLSERTPKTTFLGTRSLDDAYIKITHGVAIARLPGSCDWQNLV